MIHLIAQKIPKKVQTQDMSCSLNEILFYPNMAAVYINVAATCLYLWVLLILQDVIVPDFYRKVAR